MYFEATSFKPRAIIDKKVNTFFLIVQMFNRVLSFSKNKTVEQFLRKSYVDCYRNISPEIIILHFCFNEHRFVRSKHKGDS